MNHRLQINALMSALIDGTYQCLDAAAEALNARNGNGANKATLSKKLNLHLDWTVADVIALEDAAGRYPVTRMLARRMADADRAAPMPMIQRAGSISKECGEAVAAILNAEVSASGQEKAQAVAEIDEAIEALRHARSELEA